MKIFALFKKDIVSIINNHWVIVIKLEKINMEDCEIILFKFL